MALKDLKSNLSEFRKPIQTPLVDKKSNVNPTPFTTKPLSDKTTQNIQKASTDSKLENVQTPNVPTLNQTPIKQGVTPTPMDNTPQYLGETTPTKSNLVERFLGSVETKPFDNSSNYLGQTDTKPFNNSSNYLGETDVKEFKYTKQFLGETTPSEFRYIKNYLGETTPNTFDNSSNYLGETDTKPFNNSSNYLGETTPNVFNNSSNYLGETTPSKMNNASKFLGETTPKTVDYIPNIHADGFTKNSTNKINTNFKGVSKTQTDFDGKISLYGDSKVTRFINDKQSPYYNQLSDYKGKSKEFKTIYSKFNLKDSPNFGNIIHAPYILTGIQRRNKKEPQTWGAFGGYFDFIEPTVGIRGGVLGSTERALVDVARMGSFFLSAKGIIWGITQFGMQRTNKWGKLWTPINLLANVGTQHIGLKWDRPGVLPIGDETWKYTLGVMPKLPAKAAQESVERLAGGLISMYGYNGVQTKLGNVLKIDPKGGFDSFYGIGVTQTKRYVNTFSNVGKSHGDLMAYTKRGNKTTDFKIKYNPFDVKFTPYGRTLIPIQKDTPGVDRTRINLKEPKNSAIKDTPDFDFDVKYNPFGSKIYKDSLKVVDGQVEGERKDALKDDDIDERTKDIIKSDGLVKGSPDIKDYESVSYGKIQKLAKERTEGKYSLIPNDFRKELDNDPRVNDQGPDGPGGYDKGQIETRVNFAHPGKLKTSDQLKNRQYSFKDKSKFTDLYDKINASKIGESGTSGTYNLKDLVKLLFQMGSDGSKLQFRGTLSGITETFSPSYSEVKYIGRAEPAYMYDTFKRDITFNFKVYATSRIEMEPIWTKLERLSTYTMPAYIGSKGYTFGGVNGDRILRLTLGGLFYKTPSLLTSLSYTYSDETPWDVDYELPMGIDVSVGCTILGGKDGSLHQYDGKTYEFYQGGFKRT